MGAIGVYGKSFDMCQYTHRTCLQLMHGNPLEFASFRHSDWRWWGVSWPLVWLLTYARGSPAELSYVLNISMNHSTSSVGTTFRPLNCPIPAKELWLCDWSHKLINETNGTQLQNLWLQSLAKVEALQPKIVVPSHMQVDDGYAPTHLEASR